MCIAMKKLLCAFAVAIVSLTAVSAQDYNWGVGVRLGGYQGGASVKYKLNSYNALEGIFSIPWDNGFLATVLYQRYVPVIAQGFNFYYGAGAHVGGWDKKFSLGIDGMIGLEYKIRNAPLALSLDYKPAFNIIEKSRFLFSDFALGIRVTF